jgi:hypothetical protein
MKQKKISIDQTCSGRTNDGRIGRGSGQAMHQPALDINADVHLHPEIVLVALLGRVHLRIALLVLVLGGRGRVQDGGIDHRALLHQQAALAQILIDGLEEGAGQFPIFQQPTEAQQRGGIGRGFAAQINVEKAPEGHAIVDRIFQPLSFRQRESLQQEIHAQHALQSDWVAPRPLTVFIVVMRGDRRLECCPGHGLFHLREEAVAASQLALGIVLGIGEGQLSGHDQQAPV